MSVNSSVYAGLADDSETTRRATRVAMDRIRAMRDKVSPRGQRDDMPPPVPVQSKNRGGSTSVRGRVRSPHISGGRWWL